MSTDEIIEINPKRIEHMMKLFELNRQELLSLISMGLKNKLTEEQIFGSNFIKLSHLKRVDKIFGKSLFFYGNPAPPSRSKFVSIFFRKKEFNSKLTIVDRRKVVKTEGNINYLSALATLSRLPNFTKRKLGTYQESDSPKKIAKLIREKLYPQKSPKKKKDFLKSLINSFADYNIFVYEFAEARNLKEKTELDGFFISPNHITIKRHQNAFCREIFTLAHELGHYLLNKEEIDRINFNPKPNKITRTERWCDRFAFHFLMSGEALEKLYSLPKESLNFYNADITAIAEQNHISRLALFVHLADKGRISWQQYNNIRKESNKYKNRKTQEKEAGKEQTCKPKRVGGRTPEPILSPLEKNVYVDAYRHRVIEEYDVLVRCRAKKFQGIDEIICG